MCELEVAVRVEADLKRERKSRVHRRQAVGLSLGAILTATVLVLVTLTVNEPCKDDRLTVFTVKRQGEEEAYEQMKAYLQNHLGAELVTETDIHQCRGYDGGVKGQC